ncbi:MAG: thioredoxin family protein, partial [Bdellovibrionia bacterium]
VKSIFGPAMMMPQMASNGAGAQTGESYAKLNWSDYADSKIEEAKKSGQPVIIDFWADWCAACKELEHLTFTDPKIQEESRNFTLMKIDATSDSPELQRLKKMYRVVGLPTMIFIAPSGEIQWENTLTGFENAEAFMKRMKKAQGLERYVGSDSAAN